MRVEISDPVAGVRYTLDTQNKVARKQLIPPLARFAGSQMPSGFMGAAPTMTPPPPPGGLGAPSQAGIPSGFAGAPNLQPDVTTEKLGTKTMEGISVEGTRRTATLQVGMEGGNKPIVMVSESWYSPELKVTMLSRESDPRLGERTTRLTNVNRSEPSAALFAPPADYQVVQEAGFTAQPGKQK
jgi:hypothetical protein